MRRRSDGMPRILLSGAAFCVLVTGCSTAQTLEKDPKMSSTTEGSAEQTWDQMNARAESTQAFVPGEWSASDTAARPCGSGGAQWVISRIGPGTPTGSRETAVAAIRAHWERLGWEPFRSTTGGDTPSTRLRYPGSLSLDDGFFIDFETTVHGSTLALQTPCAPGDYDQLNGEKYAEKHTNTPPDIPGASTASERATP